MAIWSGDELNETDRQAAMDNFAPDAVDVEFIPYLDRINALPFVVTVQCCIGHLDYDKSNVPITLRPSEESEKWGYLQLMTTLEVAEWLCQLASEGKWDWLWIGGSQLWMDEAGVPGITEKGSYEIAFAWDASRWPCPAIDITNALEAICVEGSQSRTARDDPRDG